MTAATIDDQSPTFDHRFLALAIFLTTVSMLLAGFASAYIVRSASPDWIPIPMPNAFVLNTILLLASGVTLELAARSGEKRLVWWGATVLLGLGFIGGQFVAFRGLLALGLAVGANPHGAFLWILSGIHGLHLFAGLGVLAWGVVRSWNSVDVAVTGLCRIYWHFFEVVWLFLLTLLFLV